MNWQRCIASRPSQHHFAVADDTHNRVIHVANDRPVVDQEIIGNSSQPLQRLALIDADRFVAQIAAGRDDGYPEISHQEMVQRGVGQHHAETRTGRRDCGSELRLARSAIEAKRWALQEPATAASSRSETWQSCLTRSKEGYIKAKGFSSRRLRALRR